MAKQVFATKLSGVLDINIDEPSITITEIKKDTETEFDLLAVLAQYDGKNVNVSITEDKELEPLGE